MILRLVTEVEDLIMAVVKTSIVDGVVNVVIEIAVEMLLGVMGLMVDSKDVVMPVVETPVVPWLFNEEGRIVVLSGAVFVD